MEFSVVAALVLGGVFALMAVRGLNATEQRHALTSAALHVTCAFIHWAIIEFYYVISDVHGYHDTGVALVRLLDRDFARFAPEVVNLLFHREVAIPLDIYGGSSSGTMMGLSAIYIYVQGPSLVAMYVTTTWFGWLGQLCMYRVARDELAESDRMAAIFGFFYMPSAVFWGSGFTKEAFVLGFLGILVLSTYRVIRNRRVLYLAGIVFGGVGIGMLKPFTLFAYVLGVAAFVYADRAWRAGGPIRVRPVYFALAAAIAVGGVMAMGAAFPEYAPDRLSETLAEHQGGWGQTEAGSTIELQSGGARSLSEQLPNLPLALVNAFFRPSIFDIKSGPIVVAAIETTLFTLAVLSLLLSSEGRSTIKQVLPRIPLLVSSAVFVLVFGVTVGLATWNLGSLSRYRMPMMPFVGAIIFLLRQRTREAKASKEEEARARVLSPRRQRGSRAVTQTTSSTR